MSKDRQIEKVRTAAAQAAALASARKEIKRWRYGQQEHRQAGKRDLALGWGQATWESDR